MVTSAARSLRAARDLISAPGAWLPNSAGAQSADGRNVQPRDREAVAWGVLWAMLAVGMSQADREAALGALRTIIGAKYLCDWTAAEGRTQAEVLDAMERAAERLDDDRCGVAA